ncbi:MAG: hypothetical protein JJV98_19855, partial [Desulfosarcina sp.]|nr:hypothetical protein [Desulfobacterales bacterium]
MQIKRFEAKNMTEALRQIKRELGAEAVILSAKDIRKENRLLGITRKVGVEVTAAVDGGYPAHSSYRPARPTGHRPGPSAGTLPAVRKALADSLPDDVRDVVKLGGRPINRNTSVPGIKPRESLLSKKIAVGSATPTGGAYASNRVGSISNSSTSQPGFEDWQKHIHRRLRDGGLKVGNGSLDADKQHIIALVGSAGVGKTTTIAKLAARMQHDEGRR